jgi:uncharacterized PurR-regulated membrane protein YhhQ (DUF165 family)
VTESLSRNAAKKAVVVGLVSTVLFVLLALGLFVTTSLEQAKTPGEESLGVAALFILFSLPMMACAVVAVVSFLLGAVAAAYSRFRRSRAVSA